MSWFKVVVAGPDAARMTELKDILAQCGVKPVIATNVSEVLAVFQQRPVHLVFCDDSLPEGASRRFSGC